MKPVNSRRSLSAILAVLLLSSTLAACGESAESPKPDETKPAEGSGTEAVVTEEGNVRAGVKDSLPDNLDFGGKTFTIFYANANAQADFIEGPEELTGDIVDDAVIACNQAVADRLNVDLKFNHDDTADWNTVSGIVSQQIMAADPTNDVFFGQQYGMVQLVTQNAFVNVYDLKYFDFTQPWWNNVFMDEVSIGKNNRFFLTGDFTTSALRMEHVLFFNKALYANYYDDANALYTEALNGTWTLDRLAEVARGVYIDLNNNGTSDADDQLGYITFKPAASTDPFAYLGEVQYATHDEDGLVTIDLIQDRGVTLTEKVVSFFHQEGSFFRMDDANNVSTANFKNGKALFLGINQLGSAKGLRDMKDDFGFLPYPKLDEAQENYHGLVADIVLLGVVPTSSLNTDMAGAVLEALNAETYRSVVPVWYETALKVKYARDDISSQVIDLIHDAIYTNFLYAYSPCLNAAGVFMRTLVDKNSTDYISTVTKLDSGVQKRLAKINAAFEDQE